MKIDCIICGKNNLNKNTIGINKKLFANCKCKLDTRTVKIS